MKVIILISVSGTCLQTDCPRLNEKIENGRYQQGLLEKFAGTGKPTGDRIPGLPDYREKVDFGEFIGFHVDLHTGKKTPTTWLRVQILK